MLLRSRGAPPKEQKRAKMGQEPFPLFALYSDTETYDAPLNRIECDLEIELDIMPLTHTKELFAKALKGKYALGAFNVNNMELLQAIIEACEEEKAPVMLQISKGARQYANPV